MKQVRIEVVYLQLLHLDLDRRLQVLDAVAAHLGQDVDVATLETGRFEIRGDAVAHRSFIFVYFRPIDEPESALESHGDLLGGVGLVEGGARAKGEAGQLEAGRKTDVGTGMVKELLYRPFRLR